MFYVQRIVTKLCSFLFRIKNMDFLKELTKQN